MIVTPTPPPRLPEPPPWSICPSLEALPLPTFISCLVTGDLSGLVAAGAPPAEALEEAWLTLYSDYRGRTSDIQYEALMQRLRAVNALSSKITRVAMMVEAARNVVSEDLAAALRADGYKLDPTADDAAWHKQLDAIISKLRTDRMKLDTLAKGMPKADEGHAPTERSFTIALLNISSNECMRIRAQDITTGEFCEYLNRLPNQTVKQIKNKANGRRAGK